MSDQQYGERYVEIILPLAIFPGIIISGPIDETDQRIAKRLLEVTGDREVFERYWRGLFTLEQVTLKSITEEFWQIIQARREWAEAILRGELPDK